uniref:Electron transport complex subunit RsxA n=1 Tax=Candidatus Aschnera chinzeii TaxID=1485666 RepID=A0AAT9G4Q6_9ENTR|nr:MAG: electron transport complex subunit RsxA [Candidatus Aschnera chinzeii]
MSNYFALIISIVFTQNFILSKFIGICHLISISKNIKNFIGSLLPTISVIIISSIMAWCLNEFILIPFHLIYLRIFSYMLIISCITQIIEMLVRKINLIIYQTIGIFLSLITTNCMILGIILVNTYYANNFSESCIFSIVSSFSFFITTLIFSAIRDRMKFINTPIIFQGVPITLITIGLITFIFTVFII